MSAAFYALAGTVIGILGTVLLDIVRARRETRSRAREALRVVCSEFTTQLTRVRRYSGIHHGSRGQLIKKPGSKCKQFSPRLALVMNGC